MKLFDQIDMEQHRTAWGQRFDDSVSYYHGKEPAFSPAVEAQVSAAGTGGTGDMPIYYSLHSVLIPYEYTGWMDELASIDTTCYIGDWSWLNKWRVQGPDAVECLKASTINGYRKFPVGKGRHIISVTPNGKMIGDGIAFRESEDSFLCTGGLMVAPGAMLRPEGFDVTLTELTAELFNYHIQGPNSGKVMEKVCGEDVSDLEFIHFRSVTVCGQECVIYRGGMSGELGYELFGPAAFGSVIWKAIVDAGQEFGIRQLGQRALMANHLQAYFPTIWIDFVPSVVPGAEAMWRSPVDFGWGGLIDKSRDFPGKDVLMDEIEHPKRRGVTLEFDDEDIKGVFASLFDKDQEPLAQWELPTNTSAAPSDVPGVLPVLDEAGNFLGLVTNHGYTYQFRKFIGLAVLPIEKSEPGTQVYVVWGANGHRQTRLRATVTRTPYKSDLRK